MDLTTSYLAAFVLAGGQSKRMGTDKAFLELGGRPLIEHALELAHSVTGEVKIVGDAAKFAVFGDTVSDIFAARGPLAGIHAALSASKSDCNLVLGVDLPFVEARFLKFLVSKAQAGDVVVTVPAAAGYLQTLCAVYRKPFMHVAASALENGRNKIDALFSELMVCVIEEDELTAAGFSPAMFRNLNTPGDLEIARREFALRQHLS
jgi:molybdopterin-guanine dinucleotide biosynthesis protein A